MLIKRLDSIMAAEDCSNFREVMVVIGQGLFQVAMFVDQDVKLTGVLTDGDVRKALLFEAGSEALASPDISREPICSVEDYLDKVNVVEAKYEENQDTMWVSRSSPSRDLRSEPRISDASLSSRHAGSRGKPGSEIRRFFWR